MQRMNNKNKINRSSPFSFQDPSQTQHQDPTMQSTSNSPPWPGGGELGNPVMVVDLYLRVSTDRQAKEGDSLEEQETELKKFCDYRGFKINNILIEEGRSGKNTNRPEYQTLLADIRARKVNAVVVKKIDRLSRSLLDFEADAPHRSSLVDLQLNSRPSVRS